MLKINQKTKKISESIFNILVIVLVFFFNRVDIVLGESNNWIEVSKTPAGIQYLDRDSIDIKGKGIIELTTKYLEIETNTSKEKEENIYITKINCLTNKFKDISVNGEKNLTAKWQAPNGDKLLDDLISDSCENV